MKSLFWQVGITGLLLLLSSLAGVNGYAKAPYQQYHGHWRITFNGIAFAHCYLHYYAEKDRYEMSANVSTKGLIDLFDPHESTTRSQGIRKGSQWLTQSFLFSESEEDKVTRLIYNTQGKLTERLVTPEDDPDYRPPVPKEKVKGVATPGNLLPSLQSRVNMMVGESRESFALKMYDGQRLYRLKGKHQGLVPVSIGEQSTLAHKFSMSRDLLAGFTEKEINKYEEGDADVTLFVREHDMFPVMAKVDLFLGSITAKWVEP